MRYFKTSVTIILTAAVNITAQAQIPISSANYAGEMQMSGLSTDAITIKVYKQGPSQRLEIPTPNGIMVSLINTETENAFSFPQNENGPMGKQALKIDYDKIAKRMNANINDQSQAKQIGSSAVAGQYCTLYQIETGTACMTGDGIAMRVTSTDGNKMEMISLSRGAQSANLFEIPKHYTLIDISNGLPEGMVAVSSSEIPTQPEGFEMDSFLAQQAGKQVKREIKSLARDQIGSSIGGAIGGSLIGGTIGNEASKAVTGLVGGLFGKKKKKKTSTAISAQDTNESESKTENDEDIK